MKVTVIYDSGTGDMLATVGEHNPEVIKAASFEVPDGGNERHPGKHISQTGGVD